MSILDEIIAFKYIEVENNKKAISEKQLMESPYWGRKSNSLKQTLESGSTTGIIAEFKRKSPSKGVFNSAFDPAVITKGYVKHGAAGLSVLTDQNYFGGSAQDLILARETNPTTPILRKDFMVDTYQLLEAKAMGADVILLIAAALPAETIQKLAKEAKSLGLETLLEIKEASELEGNLSEYIDIVGINNRNLKDFTLDLNRSRTISAKIPDTYTKISESGINQADTIKELKTFGFKGFLLGEAFMQTQDPVASFEALVKNI